MPFTERRNELTTRLDQENGEGMVRLLGLADAQMYPELLERRELLERLCELEECVRELVATGEGVCVFSGCGTSGRTGLAVASNHNAQLPEGHQVFDALLAGTFYALLVPQESDEDNPLQGAKDLEELLQAHGVVEGSGRRAVYVGITCGLSAAYVAGQLDYAMNHPELCSAVACLGFNPASLARDVPIEGWHSTFRQVVARLQQPQEEDTGVLVFVTDESTVGLGPQKRLLINPVIGPEAVQGSSRMKGGSMTKLLLEAVISAARLPRQETVEGRVAQLEGALLCFQECQRGMYADQQFCQQLGLVLATAGASLEEGGRVLYLATSASAGWLAMIDASECFCTYGSALTDVRCFIPGGWARFGNSQLTELLTSNPDPLLRVSHDDIPWDTLTFRDTAIVVSDDLSPASAVDAILAAALAQSAAKGFFLCNLAVSSDASAPALTSSLLSQVTIRAEHVMARPAIPMGPSSGSPLFDSSPGIFSDLLLKLCLNAVSTGAHVLKGKVYENQMVDLAVSNTKLYFRSIGIIARIASVSDTAARDCLLQAIYQASSEPFSSERYLQLPVSAHIVAAHKLSRVIPISLLLAMKLASSVEDARRMLQEQPIVSWHIHH
ncbi:MAG: hypothetical protein Q8P67_28295 [archaeon]|nr:hypothetical protein [archaeon]